MLFSFFVGSKQTTSWYKFFKALVGKQLTVFVFFHQCLHQKLMEGAASRKLDKLQSALYLFARCLLLKIQKLNETYLDVEV
jgi:hypothetical protein